MEVAGESRAFQLTSIDEVLLCRMPAVGGGGAPLASPEILHALRIPASGMLQARKEEEEA